jgi:hypothetical protein
LSFLYIKVGRPIAILGNGLAGTTSVTFNGISATFTVVKDTLIKATVPSRATTGTIQVATPSGTLSSNVAFHNLPDLLGRQGVGEILSATLQINLPNVGAGNKKRIILLQ